MLKDYMKILLNNTLTIIQNRYKRLKLIDYKNV